MANQRSESQEAQRQSEEMKARKRGRAPLDSSKDVFGGSSGSGTTTLANGGKNESCAQNATVESTRKRAYPFPNHAPAQNSSSPTRDQAELNSENTRGILERALPNAMIDSCQNFAHDTFQNRHREAGLSKSSQVSANPTQMISKIVSASPMNSRMGILTYLESTENRINDRPINEVMKVLDVRYGVTDSDRAWGWLTAFAESWRESNETFDDFWTRFNRCATRPTPTA